MKHADVFVKKQEMLAAGLSEQEVMETVMQGIAAFRMSQTERLNALMKMQVLGCDAEKQSLRLGFLVEEWQLNPAGTLHGGMYATAVDIGLGMLAHYYGNGYYCVTTNMNLNYIRPIRKGDMLVVETCMEKAGRSLMSLTVRGWAASDGKTAVTASGTYMVSDRKIGE
ncbi:MAG: PaaI family thioesterase [Lachnospiraceae bacterium]|nr:PaaI family thioesterase [Lachnospiraceae bacterium]